MIVTSREVLHLYGEHEYLVLPLGLPEKHAQQSAAVLSECESVTLFIQRAKAAKHDFEITEENAPSIAEICLRLEEGYHWRLNWQQPVSDYYHPIACSSGLSDRLKILTGGARQPSQAAADDT